MTTAPLLFRARTRYRSQLGRHHRGVSLLEENHLRARLQLRSSSIARLVIDSMASCSVTPLPLTARARRARNSTNSGNIICWAIAKSSRMNARAKIIEICAVTYLRIIIAFVLRIIQSVIARHLQPPSRSGAFNRNCARFSNRHVSNARLLRPVIFLPKRETIAKQPPRTLNVRALNKPALFIIVIMSLNVAMQSPAKSLVKSNLLYPQNHLTP